MSASSSINCTHDADEETKSSPTAMPSQTIQNNAAKLVEIIQEYRDAALNDVRQKFQDDLLRLNCNVDKFDAEWKERLEGRLAAAAEAAKVELLKAKAEAEFWKEEAGKANGALTGGSGQAKVAAEMHSDLPRLDSVPPNDVFTRAGSSAEEEVQRLVQELAARTELCDTLTRQRDKAEADRQQTITTHQSDVVILRKIIDDWARKYDTLQKTHEDLLSRLQPQRKRFQHSGCSNTVNAYVRDANTPFRSKPGERRP